MQVFRSTFHLRLRYIFYHLLTNVWCKLKIEFLSTASSPPSSLLQGPAGLRRQLPPRWFFTVSYLHKIPSIDPNRLHRGQIT